MTELNKKLFNRYADEHCPSVNENYINNKKKSSANLLRFILLIMLVALITLSFIPKVYALGMTPAATTIDFEPGTEKEYKFSIVNSENKDVNIVIYAQGELASYIELSARSDIIKAGEASKTYSFKLKLPDSLSPGIRPGEIVVMEIPDGSSESGTSVNARVALVHQVNVYVPYPGKYIDSGLDIVAAGEMTKFFVPINNRGTETIGKISATIEIYLAGEKLATLETNEISLDKGKTESLYSEWRPSKIGNYLAKATIKYDGAEKVIEKNFEVGETLINIEDIVVNNFKLGEVAKFEMSLNNKWSDDIKNVFVRMEFYQNEQKIAEAKTPTQDIKAGTTGSFVAFFDTAGIAQGTYDVRIILNYDGKTAERETTAQITDNSLVVFGFSGVSGKTNWMMIGIIIGIILVVGNVAWFIFLRKKFFKKKK